MNLRRVEKIRCYASPPMTNFPLLIFGSNIMLPHRGFRSETSLQHRNMASIRKGLDLNKNQNIEALCQSFKLSSVKHFSPFNKTKIDKWMQTAAAKSREEYYVKEKCKKCEKIRQTVKDFIRNTFETDDSRKKKTALTQQPNRIRMHIVESSGNTHAFFESHPIVNETKCFGCDELKREPYVRGPPILSPVCTGENEEQINVAPLGEGVKSIPERIKKITKIDRPHSLGPRKRILNNKDDDYRETSIHEIKKPRSH